MSDRTDPLADSAGSATARLSREEVDQLLDDQRQRSERGQPFLVEIYLEKQPSLKGHSEAVLDLIYNEMMLREAHGNKPTLQEYLGRFPDLAQELADQFEIEGVLQDGAITEHASGQAPTTDVDMPAWRGFDFHVLEILGRGGKGIVYKAMQKSLQRVVALKMIRSGDQATPEDLARFRLEAEAVARLQHSNLVHIYEVGEWEGQPYLALEYVDGGNLAQRLNGAAWPAQESARIIHTLALAMHHAHLKGIVHRDLKPANVLLSSISSQQPDHETTTPMKTESRPTADDWLLTAIPKITDFGLAKFVLGDSTGLTETGSFLGTPAYTAPEQALGKTHDIGPAADVYALGAILYELVTGQPPFQGPSVYYILEQVRATEPVAPTRITPKLPKDLETICLKCLEKDPRRRYASAQLLAEDLQRFQTGQPIQARPVGQVERVHKWAKRRPAVAALIAVAVVGTLTVAIGGWWSAYTQSRLRQEADKNFRDSEDNFADALSSVGLFLEDVGGVDLEIVPQLTPLRKRLLGKAKDFYTKFLHNRGEDPKIRHQAGRGYSRLGTIHELLDEHSAAETAYRHSIDLLDDPNASAEQRRELGRALNQYGGLLKKLGRNALADETVRKGLAIRKELVERFPDDRAYLQDLAASHHDLGTILVRLPKERDAACAAYEKALGIQEKLAGASPPPEIQRDRARTLNNLGLAQQFTKPADAVNALTGAVVINQKLVNEHATVPAYRRELARTCNNLANVPNGLDTFHREKKFAEAIELLKQLTRDFPTVPAYRQDLAGVYRSIGVFHELAKRNEEATTAYGISLTMNRQLADESPEIPEYQQRLANLLVRVGSMHDQGNRLDVAERHYVEAVAILEKVTRSGSSASFHSDLGRALQHVAVLQTGRTKFVAKMHNLGLPSRVTPNAPWPVVASTLAVDSELDRALALFQRAADSQRSACDADPASTAFLDNLRYVYLNLTYIALERGRHAVAAETALKRSRLNPRKSDLLNGAEALVRCVPLATADPNLTKDQQVRVAKSYGDQAIQLLRQRLAAGINDDNERQALFHELAESPPYLPLRRRPDFRKLLEDLQNNPARIT